MTSKEMQINFYLMSYIINPGDNRSTFWYHCGSYWPLLLTWFNFNLSMDK